MKKKKFTENTVFPKSLQQRLHKKVYILNIYREMAKALYKDALTKYNNKKWIFTFMLLLTLLIFFFFPI